MTDGQPEVFAEMVEAQRARTSAEFDAIVRTWGTVTRSEFADERPGEVCAYMPTDDQVREMRAFVLTTEAAGVPALVGRVEDAEKELADANEALMLHQISGDYEAGRHFAELAIGNKINELRTERSEAIEALAAVHVALDEAESQLASLVGERDAARKVIEAARDVPWDLLLHNNVAYRYNEAHPVHAFLAALAEYDAKSQVSPTPPTPEEPDEK